MSGAESSAASWAVRWRERVERIAQLPPARAVRRWVVGEDVEGELRAVEASRTAGGLWVRGPVLVLALAAALSARLVGLGWWSLVAGALGGWGLGRRVYRGAIMYERPDPAEARFCARDLEVGNWLRIRRGGLVARVARVTGLDDAGASVRVTLSNGQTEEWPWSRRVPMVSMRLPVPASWGPKDRCLYALAHDELSDAWGLPRCGRDLTYWIGRRLLCDEHVKWATKANPGVRPLEEMMAPPTRSPGANQRDVVGTLESDS